MKRNTIILIALAAIAGFFIFKRKGIPLQDQRLVVRNVVGTDIEGRMTDSEIRDVYVLLTEYFQKNIKVPQTDPLFARLQVISVKYNIFT